MASSSNDLPPRLPDPNRYITDTAADGKSVFTQAVAAPLGVSSQMGKSLSRLAYVAPRAPVDLNGSGDVAAYVSSLASLPPLVPAGGGSIVWCVDMPPGAQSPLHRTISVDIAVQVAGELELTLDSGETRVLRPGDVTIQRATMHKWRNPSTTEWARMVAVMNESQPLQGVSA